MSNVPPSRDATRVANRIESIRPQFVSDFTGIRPAKRSEIDFALRLILGRPNHPASDDQILDFLSYALHRGIDTNTIEVIERDGRIAWAALPVISPGRTMLLLCPGGVPDATSADAAVDLVQHIVQSHVGRGVQLVQVLFDPDAPALREVFQRAGFSHLAELVYLHRPLGRKTATPLPLPDGMEWLTYSAAHHERFAATIARSYERSLDCPALNGLRSIGDVIAGHQAAGDFDPAWWFLLKDRDQDLGVLLLSRTRHAVHAELVYLGLPPQARGRRLAPILLNHALVTATQSGCQMISLAVDSQNHPALRLYHGFGMKETTSRIAMIRVLSEPSAGTVR